LRARHSKLQALFIENSVALVARKPVVVEESCWIVLRRALRLIDLTEDLNVSDVNRM